MDKAVEILSALDKNIYRVEIPVGEQEKFDILSTLLSILQFLTINSPAPEGVFKNHLGAISVSFLSHRPSQLKRLVIKAIRLTITKCSGQILSWIVSDKGSLLECLKAGVSDASVILYLLTSLPDGDDLKMVISAFHPVIVKKIIVNRPLDDLGVANIYWHFLQKFSSYISQTLRDGLTELFIVSFLKHFDERWPFLRGLIFIASRWDWKSIGYYQMNCVETFIARNLSLYLNQQKFSHLHIQLLTRILTKEHEDIFCHTVLDKDIISEMKALFFEYYSLEDSIPRSSIDWFQQMEPVGKWPESAFLLSIQYCLKGKISLKFPFKCLNQKLLDINWQVCISDPLFIQFLHKFCFLPSCSTVNTTGDIAAVKRFFSSPPLLKFSVERGSLLDFLGERKMPFSLFNDVVLSGCEYLDDSEAVEWFMMNLNEQINKYHSLSAIFKRHLKSFSFISILHFSKVLNARELCEMIMQMSPETGLKLIENINVPLPIDQFDEIPCWLSLNESDCLQTTVCKLLAHGYWKSSKLYVYTMSNYHCEMKSKVINFMKKRISFKVISQNRKHFPVVSYSLDLLGPKVDWPNLNLKERLMYLLPIGNSVHMEEMASIPISEYFVDDNILKTLLFKSLDSDFCFPKQFIDSIEPLIQIMLNNCE